MRRLTIALIALLVAGTVTWVAGLYVACSQRRTIRELEDRWAVHCGRIRLALETMHDNPRVNLWAGIMGDLRECATARPAGDTVEAWLAVMP